jgi:hypothetical protein
VEQILTKIYKMNDTFYVWHGEGNCDNATSDLREALHIQVDLIADGHEPVSVRDHEGTAVDEFYLQKLWINVQQTSAESSYSDDDSLAGLYCVQFSTFLRERESLRKEELAEAALGIFHARQGIECRDDFEIEVIDAFGRVVDADRDFTDFSDDDGDVEKIGEPLTLVESKPQGSLEDADKVTVIVEESEVWVTRAASNERSGALILRKFEKLGHQFVVLDRLLHKPNEGCLGEWAVSGANSTVLCRNSTQL